MGSRRMAAPGMSGPVTQQQEEATWRCFNGPTRMAAPGIDEPVMQQQEEATWKYWNGPTKMAAHRLDPGMRVLALRQHKGQKNQDKEKLKK